MTRFTFGSDPELFVRDKKTGLIISAHGLIEGDKYSPTPVQGGAIQVDGLALEFNTNPVPIYDHSCGVFDITAFNKNFVAVMKELATAVSKKGDLGLEIVSTATFDPEYYASLPEEAKKLGCDPDFDGYTGNKNIPPSSDIPKRAAAGHIHIGWGQDFPTDHPDHLAICHQLVRQLDLYVGLGFVFFEDEKDAERRTMYGKAGAYRPKSYGVEYRTPGNKWLLSAQHRQYMWSLVGAAIHNLCMASVPSCDNVLTKATSTVLRRCIDENDKEAAARLLRYELSSEVRGSIRSVMYTSFGITRLNRLLSPELLTALNL